MNAFIAALIGIGIPVIAVAADINCFCLRFEKTIDRDIVLRTIEIGTARDDNEKNRALCTDDSVNKARENSSSSAYFSCKAILKDTLKNTN